MKFSIKDINKSLIEILVENYFQCIYYLTVTDLGDGQDLSLENTDIPQDIRVDEQDMLLIHSDKGVYNLHLIDLKKRNFISKCVMKITYIVNSPDAVIPIEELNNKLQQRVVLGW